MTDILKCDLCGADAGDDPYHATMDENGHVHICAACFDPQQHDVAVLRQQRDELIAQIEQLRCQLAGCGAVAMQNTCDSTAQRAAPGDYGYSASYAEVCLAVDREIAMREQRDELLAALQDALGDLEFLKNAPDSAYARPDDETIKAVRAAIAKAGGNVPPDCYQQRDELAEETVWEVLNGVCSYGFYGTKDEAEKVCFDMQKSHDLSGSLAAFNVRPRYTKAGGEV